MYLVLRKIQSLSMGPVDDYYQCYAVSDVLEARKYLKDGCKVYKLDTLTQLSDIIVHTEEVEV